MNSRQGNVKKLKGILPKTKQNELNAVTFTQVVKGYREVVNKCRLNQQDAFWAILLSEKEEAIEFLGEEEAKRTMLGMVEEAFRTHVKI